MKARQDQQFRESLNLDEYRIAFQTIYFHDIRLFAEDVCDRWTRDKKSGQKYPSAEFHDELWQACKNPEDVLAIVARDHAKTTAVCKILVLWLLLFEIEPSILLIMSKGLGEEVIGDIRRELETSQAIKLIWGIMVPHEDKKNSKSDKWRQRELQLLNGCEIKSITKGEAIRGRRPTKVIVDDPQENKDVKNPIIANEFYNWIFTSVYPVLSSGGSMVVLGTIISNICFVNMLKQQAVIKNFKVIEYTAIIDFDPKTDIAFYQEGNRLRVRFTKGRPLWPERWSMKALEERCEKMMEEGGDVRKFLQEYCNIPFVLNASPVFDVNLKFKVLPALRTIGTFGIQVFSEFPKVNGALDPHVYFSLGIDVANGRQGGDYSTITMRSLDFNLYRQYRGHCAQHVLPKVVDAMLEGVEDVTIVAENNIALAFLNACAEYEWYGKLYKQRSFDKATNKETDVLGWHTNVKTKLIMVNGLQRFYATGDAEISKELLEEIEHYYHDEQGGMNAVAPYHDDLVIADSLSVQGILHGVPDVMPEFI